MVHVYTSRYFAHIFQRSFNRHLEKTLLFVSCNVNITVKNICYLKSHLLEKVPGTNAVLQKDYLFGQSQTASNSDIIYSTVLEDHKQSISIKTEQMEILHHSIPIVLRHLINEKELTDLNMNEETQASDKPSVKYFPFDKYQDIDIADYKNMTANADSEIHLNDSPEIHVSVKDDIAYRLKTYDERRKKKQQEDNKLSNSSDIYEDSLLTNLENSDSPEFLKRPKYGTPNPEIAPSSVPCGGCGASLHCQAENIPGYLPSELFIGKNKGELRSSLCQRCFFLETYDVALNIRVSPEIYEKSLQPITSDKALVIIVLDILDVPCSIWPGLFKLLGTKRPVFIVGNKVDLLPPDCPDHLVNVMKSLTNAVKQSGLSNLNIKHVALTSAKTGYGIEDLISRLQVLWGTKGNIYIVGCTNAGKSTLFNAFLGSDMCQNQASDLIVRATTSPWPGTTLNLLKFPLMKPTGERITRRMRRLKEEKFKSLNLLPPKKRLTFDYTEATLTGHIGRTFVHDALQNEASDPFLLNAKKSSFAHMGILDKSYQYKESKWLFDTPGTVQPDQLLGLLTHNELLQVLPKSMIEPQTFSLRVGQTLFIGGLARIDVLFISNQTSVRLTVFSSSHLPITIVKSVNASNFYRSNLGKSIMKVPEGDTERLLRWPPLKPVNIFLTSLAPEGESCADIILSSAGFIAVSGDDEIELRGWTPGGRGVYIRDPPMLPSAVKLKGKRIKNTPAFHGHKIYVPSHNN